MNLETAYRFSVAPMMDWTDRHCRMFHRCLSQRALLWTEMVTAKAVIHGDRKHLIDFAIAEHPVVLQLGGSDPSTMAEAARVAEEFGYDEVNINCGCPSNRVQSGAFGACLMAQPEQVARCVADMSRAVDIPITVKCRIAIDELPERETLFAFVDRVADAGCRTFTVHARKAWLSGLSPKENREVPPLNYALVAELKTERPDLRIILNGGLSTLETCKSQLEVFDGVMLGRAAYQSPALLGHVDAELFGEGRVVTPMDAIKAYRPYMQDQLDSGVGLHAMTRHMLGLFNGQPGARAWRRTLSENAPRAGAGLAVVDAALEALSVHASV